MLYEVAIFTYSKQNNEWHVFNELGTRGYICLLNTPGHFDVLLGVDGDPVIPFAAHTHGINRDNFNTSDEAWQCLQHDYCFPFVFQFPEHFVGVTILNKPVVEFKAKAKSATTSNDAGTFIRGEKNIHQCDFPGCNYSSHKMKAISMHKFRCHSLRTHELTAHKTGCQTAHIKSRENIAADGDNESVLSSETVNTVQSHTVDSVEPDSDVNSVTSNCSRRTERIVDISPTSKKGQSNKYVHQCEFPNCNYATDKIKSITMHKIRCHYRSRRTKTGVCVTL